MMSTMHEVAFSTLTALLLLTLYAIFLLPPNSPSRVLAFLDLILVLGFWLYLLVLIIRSRRE
ncbi:hypothetical protein [Vulcanisaeta thermophila]|uniref:hypothetical protein n=1 Tax=Vulcanisaeta thermophila TaxID=867917 RepID=UPI00117E3BBD|nr:hypothetical protein [Vulcanisaeta thermophila]